MTLTGDRPRFRRDQMRVRFHEDAAAFLAEHRQHGGLDAEPEEAAEPMVVDGVDVLPCEVVCRCGARFKTTAAVEDLIDPAASS
jgi:hypothetical protein